MKIIITMAGQGTRFRDIGFKCPKHEIMAKGKTLFEWSLLSLKDFFEDSFIFIARKDYYNKDFIISKCLELGINNFKIVEIEEFTRGQAETVMFAEPYLSGNEGIAIYNIDTYIEEYQIKKTLIKHDLDGYVPTFIAEGNHWSFAKLGYNKQITDIVEKKRISEFATIGFYYFKNWYQFKELFELYKEEIIRNNREIYVAPLYKYMIDQRGSVYSDIIESTKVHVLGTPEEVRAFAPNYLDENEDKR